MNKKSDEYQTPKIYIEAAKLVMGKIDLDPASSEINNKRLKIPHIFTKETNGLNQKWFGNVWLNEPYSKPNLTLWTDKLIIEYNRNEACSIEQTINLIPSFTSEKWYQKLLNHCSAFCLLNHRIDFLLNGIYQTTPRTSHTFFYIGQKGEKFCEIFEKFGFVKNLI